MTKLSPAAQAIAKAALNASSFCIEGTCPYKGEEIAAAALRAAVNELAPEKTIEDIDYVHQSYVDGYKDALYEILIIVNELETQ